MSQLQRQMHSSLPWEPHIWLRVYLNIERKLCALVPQIDMCGFWFFVCAYIHFIYFLSLFLCTYVFTHVKLFLLLQSAQNRLLIKNGKVVNEDGMVDNDVYVEDGIIKWVLFYHGVSVVTEAL